MEGKVFGKYTVLNRIDNGKPGKHYECLCECGNIRIKAGTELRAGRATQCRECSYHMLHNPHDKLGLKFGRWTITKYLGMHRKSQQFEITCACGEKGKSIVAELKKGRSTQCRKCGDRQASKKNTSHGMHNEKIYKVWSSMKGRCDNTSSTTYKYYGGRGIKVCRRWKSFDNFYADMGERPEGMTLDRIDNDGNYEPSNCRWITHKENCNNTRKNKIIVYQGEAKSISLWAEHLSITHGALTSYLNRHTFEEAVRYYKKNNK